MLERIRSLNERNKSNNRKEDLLYYRIDHDDRNFFILDSKCRRYTNIQTLRDIVVLLNKNTQVYITNLSELLKANKVNKYCYMDYKDWNIINSMIGRVCKQNRADIFVILREQDIDKWLARQVLKKNFEILLDGIYCKLVLSNRTLYLISDIVLVVDDFTKMKLSDTTFSEIKIMNLDITRVTNLEHFFSRNEKLRVLHIENFNSKNVVNFSSIFKNCYMLEYINIENLIVNKAADLNSMFSGCYSIKELDLQHFNMNTVNNIKNMFSNCKDLEKLKIENWTLSDVFTKNKFSNVLLSNLFRGCNCLDRSCVKKFLEICDEHILFGD